MKRIKLYLIIGAALFLLGAALCLVSFGAAGFDISELSGQYYTQKTEIVSEDVSDISIKADTADVRIAFWSGEGIKVEAFESDDIRVDVKNKNGQLTIEFNDTRKWYDPTSWFFNSSKDLTVYIPEGGSYNVSVSISTGDVTLSGVKSINNLSITASTGDVRLGGIYASGNLNITTSTGDVSLGGIYASGNVSIDTSTGDIEINSSEIAGNLNVKVSTGDSELDGVKVKNISIFSKTGDVDFEDLVAEDVTIETSTGDVVGSFIGDMIYRTETSTGDVKLPPLAKNGGFCKIKTSTGDIIIGYDD